MKDSDTTNNQNPDQSDSKRESSKDAPAEEQPRSLLLRLPVLPPHPCAYIDGQIARDRGFVVSRLDSKQWAGLLESGWRRSGMMIYEPDCPMCRQCYPVRIPIARFNPNRSQRRTIKSNSDLTARIVPVQITDERAELYHRYINTKHDGLMDGSRAEMTHFLGRSAVDTVEIEYRLGDDPDARLLSVGTIDRTPIGWSCVYCYYDPDEPKRSLGTYNVLTAVDLCRSQCPAGDDAFVYLGYWVPGSRTMSYKSRFRVCEVRGHDGRWREMEE